MIIVLKNADFSSSNIGTLSTWRISRSLGVGATYEGVTSVDKNAAFSATVTIAEGYELDTAGVTVTMGGAVLSDAHSISGNVITITIAEVTGNVLIKVPTINTAIPQLDTPSIILTDNIISGNTIANATSYELFEKEGNNYTSFTTATAIDFKLDTLELVVGTHTFVVRAKADGYEDSEYSNEVVYTVEDSTGVTYLSNTYIKSNGVSASANGYTSTDYVAVSTGEQWHYVGTTSGSSAISVAGYDESQTFVKAILGAIDGAGGQDFTIPEGIAHIRACGKTNSGVNLVLSKISS